MFDQARYSRAISANVDEIERRLRSVEQRLERAGGHAFAKPAQAANDVADALASALSGVADRFRGGTVSSATRRKSATKRRGSATTRCAVFPRRSSSARWFYWAWQSAWGFSWAWSAAVVDG